MQCKNKKRSNKYFLNSFNNGIKIKVVGIINTIAFQKARICAEKLYQHLSFKFSIPQIIEMFQVEWHEYIHKLKRVIINYYHFNNILYYNNLIYILYIYIFLANWR